MHAQHNATRTTNMDRRGTRETNSVHVASLNVIENQQDSKTEKTAVGTWRQRVEKVVRVRARRAQEESEQCARRLEGNQERARKKTRAGH